MKLFLEIVKLFLSNPKLLELVLKLFGGLSNAITAMPAEQREALSQSLEEVAR